MELSTEKSSGKEAISKRTGTKDLKQTVKVTLERFKTKGLTVVVVARTEPRTQSNPLNGVKTAISPIRRLISENQTNLKTITAGLIYSILSLG